MDSYLFIMYHADGTELTLRGNKIVLDDIILDFKAWLKGCEFSDSLIEQIGRDESVGDGYGN